jgi:nucleotide-binding universal stress UspA family protein
VDTAHLPFTDVLIPLDGSPIAERALGPAVELVTRTGVPLRLLRRVFTDEAEEGAAYLAGLADRYAGLTDAETQIVDRDSIPDAIIDGLEPGTLVCMSSHGRDGITRATVGSVTEALLRMLDRPTLVIGPHVTGDSLLKGRVVACVDGSPESERTLGPASRWAAVLDLPLWLVEVGLPGKPAEWATNSDVFETGHVAALADRLDHVEGWDVLHDDHPARALADFAGGWPTALLVMATHGRTGWHRLRLGSVTSATVHGAPRPVLVVPAAPMASGGAGAEDPAAEGAGR